jgi:dTDP-glucose 4,6-dehydratase
MKVLITGGCGFIGSQVVREFVNAGYKTVVFDSLEYSGFKQHLNDVDCTFFQGNLKNIEDIKDVFVEYGCFDIVIHAAAESSVDKSIKGYEDFIMTNILGSANLFQVCLQYKVPKIVNFGTDEVYGHLKRGDSSFTEDTPINPRNIYSASKASQLLFANAFKETFDLPIVNICPSNCYGPRQLPEKLLPRMMYLIETDKDLPIYGTGQNIREWLFVEDAARAVRAVAEKGIIGETYNVGSENEKSNLAIISILGNILNKSYSINFVEDRKGHDFRYSVDCSKIKKLGWEPQVDIQSGLEKTVKWYKENWIWLEENYKAVWK